MESPLARLVSHAHTGRRLSLALYAAFVRFDCVLVASHAVSPSSSLKVSNRFANVCRDQTLQRQEGRYKPSDALSVTEFIKRRERE